MRGHPLTTTPDQRPTPLEEIMRQRNDVMAHLKNLVTDDNSDPTGITATALLFLVAQLPSRTWLTQMINELGVMIRHSGGLGQGPVAAYVGPALVEKLPGNCGDPECCEQLTGEPPQDVAEPLDPSSPLYHSLYRQRWKVGPDGRRAKADHTVADIEPSTETAELSALWDDVALVRGSTPIVRVFTGGDDFSPAEARQLAAELLSAAARAEQPTRVQDAADVEQAAILYASAGAQDGQDIPDAILVGLLAAVGVTVTPVLVASWTPGQRQDATRWASCTHRAASGIQMDVPERPTFLPETGDQRA